MIQPGFQRKDFDDQSIYSSSSPFLELRLLLRRLERLLDFLPERRLLERLLRRLDLLLPERLLALRLLAERLLRFGAMVALKVSLKCGR